MDDDRRPDEASVRELGRPSPVLDVVASVAFPTILVFSVYLHVAGHNQPGGGFIGGLVAGAALVLRYITGRAELLSARFRVPSSTLLAAGALVAVGTAVVPLLLGNAALEHHSWTYDVPVLGTVKWTSALVFDTGIYLVVVGVVGSLIDVLGGERGGRGGPAVGPSTREARR